MGVGSYYGLPGSETPFEGIEACGLDTVCPRNRHASEWGLAPGSNKTYCITDRTCPSGPGLLIAYRYSDGKILKARRLHLPGNQYPAVGYIGTGTHRRLVVTAGIGWQPNIVKGFLENLNRI